MMSEEPFELSKEDREILAELITRIGFDVTGYVNQVLNGDIIALEN